MVWNEGTVQLDDGFRDEIEKREINTIIHVKILKFW